MPTNTKLSPAERSRSYRERLRAAGLVQTVLELPEDMMARIDDLKKQHRLPNRNVLIQELIERGMQMTQ